MHVYACVCHWVHCLSAPIGEKWNENSMSNCMYLHAYTLRMKSLNTMSCYRAFVYLYVMVFWLSFPANEGYQAQNNCPLACLTSCICVCTHTCTCKNPCACVYGFQMAIGVVDLQLLPPPWNLFHFSYNIMTWWKLWRIGIGNVHVQVSRVSCKISTYCPSPVKPPFTAPVQVEHSMSSFPHGTVARALMFRRSHNLIQKECGHCKK